MSTVFVKENEPAVAGTHALIIGVGSYPHLLGGAGPLLRDPMGLSQLSSPPISAKAVCDWFLARQSPKVSPFGFYNPNRPLASVEMVLSPPGQYTLPDGKQVDIEVASTDGIAHSFQVWLERLGRCPDSAGVLYFCGHGMMADHDYLLAADFGRNPYNPWSNAFDLSGTIRGITRMVQGPLYFFVDACRAIPRTLLYTLGATPLPLLNATLVQRVINSSCLLLQASGEGESAFAVPGEVSRFTDALIRGLSGYAGKKVPGKELWEVSGDNLSRAVQAILADSQGHAGFKQQLPRIEFSGGASTFHVETEPTRDFIELNINLWKASVERRFETPSVTTEQGLRRIDAASKIPEQRGVKVFVSCATVDLAAARKLYLDLESRGHRPWLSEESLLPGQDKKQEITKAIRSSDLFISVMSSKSVSQRGYFQKELREALEVLEELPPSSIFVVPARLDECEFMDERLRKLYPVDLFPIYEDGRDRLLKAIDTVFRTQPSTYH